MTDRAAAANSIYDSAYSKGDAVAAQKTLDQISDKCLQEQILQDVVAKETINLVLSTKGNATEGRDDTLWVRYNNTVIPMLTLENVPKTCK